MKDYISIIEDNMDEEVRFLQELIKINSEGAESVTAPNGDVYPFGEGVQRAYEFVMKEAERMGFKTRNFDNYGGDIEYHAVSDSEDKSERKTVGILGHLDVVPAGDGWSVPAYSATLKDGYMYGRGTTDDKGPTVAALFAIKALKEAGFEPANNVRLILGLDEETNWYGMDYYMKKAGMPDYGFTPDADFPVVYAEKGIIVFDIVKKINQKNVKGLQLRKLEGGSASNMVAENAKAIVNSQENEAYIKIKEQATQCDLPIKVRNVGKSIEISAQGKSAHAAHPDAGKNAISILMTFLSNLNFANDEVNDFIAFYNEHIGMDVFGERMGCEVRDDDSGRLTLNVGLVSFDKKALSLTVNIRYPVTFDADYVYDRVIEITDKYGMGIVKGKDQAPIYFPKDSNMIKTFMDVYQKFTGDLKSEPISIGGGTYARAMKNCVGFGAMFPGDPDLMHQKDECISIKNLEVATKIYAEAIMKITREGFEL